MEAPPREHGTLPKQEVAVRLVTYLQCMGLSAAEAQAKVAAELERYAASEDAKPVDSTLTDIIEQLDAWLEQLCESANLPERCRPGLVAWHLRPLLAEHPEILLRSDSQFQAEVIERAANAAAQSAPPEPTPSPMPLQSFGAVPQILQPSFWRGLVASAGGGLVRRLKRERG